MKVLFINSVCAYGSTGKIFAEICRILNARGDSTLLCYARGNAFDDIETYKIGNRASFYTHALLTRLTDHHESGSYFSTIQLIKKIRSWNPDIIHLGNIHGYYLNIPLLTNYLKTLDIPVVWTLHDCWSFTGHCSHFTDVHCDKWKTGCNHCVKRKIYPASLLFDCSESVYKRKRNMFTGFRDLTIVTPGEWLASCVKESFLKDYSVKTIANGIDHNVFYPRSIDIKYALHAEGKHIILGVATPWDKRKGLDDFIALRNILPKSYMIVLVGVTTDQQVKLPDGIIGIKRTESADELAGLYSAADVYVNPTYCDTFPTTNIEAMSCGTPVAAYDAGGAAEIITENTGRVVPMGNVEKMAESIDECISSVNREDCRQNGLKYERRDRFEEYCRLYDSLQAGKRS